MSKPADKLVLPDFFCVLFCQNNVCGLTLGRVRSDHPRPAKNLVAREIAPPILPGFFSGMKHSHLTPLFPCLWVGAQVRFAFELLCALQPGIPVMALHGKCKHARRTQIYLDFVRRPGAVLLATDIAARGLDFPSVDWVIQVRCHHVKCRLSTLRCVALWG